MADVKKNSVENLREKLGIFAFRLIKMSNGVDNSPVQPNRNVKVVSSEDTLEEDSDDIEILENYIVNHAKRISKRLKIKKLLARTLTLKIKKKNFISRTYSVTFNTPFCSSRDIYVKAIKLLEKIDISFSIRLIGVAVSNLLNDSAPIQYSLFENKERADEIPALSIPLGQ